MKLVFMGTPDFSVAALDALVEAGHEIAAVYTQPPRPAGRGKKDRPTPVHARAEALGLPVFTPKSLKSDEALATFQSHGAEIAVVVAYGLILPQAILDAPKKGCLNIHASLLPRWRGAAPIHRHLFLFDHVGHCRKPCCSTPCTSSSSSRYVSQRIDKITRERGSVGVLNGCRLVT